MQYQNWNRQDGTWNSHCSQKGNFILSSGSSSSIVSKFSFLIISPFYISELRWHLGCISKTFCFHIIIYFQSYKNSNKHKIWHFRWCYHIHFFPYFIKYIYYLFFCKTLHYNGWINTQKDYTSQLIHDLVLQM